MRHPGLQHTDTPMSPQWAPIHRCQAPAAKPRRSRPVALRRRRAAVALLGFVLLATAGARAQTPPGPPAAAKDGAATRGLYIPDLSRLLPRAEGPAEISSTVQILVLLTLLAIAPGILLMMTSFVRILVVLVLLRQALGTQQLPPSQVLVGMALFLTFLVMGPTWKRIHADAVEPYLSGQINQLDAIGIAGRHLRHFMLRQIEAAGNEDDVYMMVEYARQAPIPPQQQLRADDVPFSALVPAFLLSELKSAFVIGFRIYLPFLVIDMVIATVLVSMGMLMLPPVLISLPFKLLLFVLADGWHLVVGSLMASIQG